MATSMAATAYVSGCKGTLVIQPGATFSVQGTFNDAMVIGRDGGSGTVIQNGGTFTFQSERQSVVLLICREATSNPAHGGNMT